MCAETVQTGYLANLCCLLPFSCSTAILAWLPTQKTPGSLFGQSTGVQPSICTCMIAHSGYVQMSAHAHLHPTLDCDCQYSLHLIELMW